jgi:hypothetical protein
VAWEEGKRERQLELEEYLKELERRFVNEEQMGEFSDNLDSNLMARLGNTNSNTGGTSLKTSPKQNDPKIQDLKAKQNEKQRKKRQRQHEMKAFARKMEYEKEEAEYSRAHNKRSDPKF